MPSSSFIVNSEFQPMSYQELLHPVLTQTQYQRELDEKYTQLDLQADKLEQLANSAVDQASYEKYRAYASRLREEASNLSKYGLRGRDNARFMELFRDYGREIQPLLDAQQKRERLIAMQQQLSMQDPTSLYDRSAGNISLEELMRNPSAAPIRQSGELLRQQAAAMATNLTNEIKSSVFSKTKTPGYLAFTQKYGLSSADVAAFVANPNSPDANKVLRAIYDQVMTSSGVKENWEGDAYNRASQYVGMGLWNAIGKQLEQPLTDNWALEEQKFKHQSALQAQEIAARERMQRAAQRHASREASRQRQHQLSMMNAQKQAISNIPSNVVPTFVNQPKVVQERRDKFNYYLNTKKYFYKKRDGSYQITDAGMRALFDKGTHSTAIGSSVTGAIQYAQVPNKDKGFYDFMKSTGMLTLGVKRTGTVMQNGKRVGHGTISRAQLSKNVNTFFTANELGYDINLTPKLAHELSTSDAKQYKERIASTISDKELKALGVSREDIAKGMGNTLFSSEKDITMPLVINGEVKNVKLPESINPTAIGNVTNAMKYSLDITDILQQAVTRGQLPTSYDKNGKPKTWGKASQQQIQDYINATHTGIYNEVWPTIERERAGILQTIGNKPIKIDYSGNISSGGIEDFLQEMYGGNYAGDDFLQ